METHWLRQAWAQCRASLNRSTVPPATPAPSPPSLRPSAADGLEQQRDLIARVRSAYGFSDAEFDLHLRSAIDALANWLHCLPGPPATEFGAKGGALRQALTTALFCLQAAEGRTFDGSTTEAPSNDLTQRWRLACALGGLFTPLEALLGHLDVVDDDGELWLPTAEPLVPWLQARGTTRYHYRWRPGGVDTRLSVVYIAARCIDGATYRFIALGAPRIAASLLGCLAGTDKAATNPVVDVVERIAVAIASGQEAGKDSTADDRPQVLKQVMRQLFAASDWLPNSPGSPVWFGADGLFLVWPDAATAIKAALQARLQGGKAMPTLDQLLAQLAAAGCIATAADGPTLTIQPPGVNRRLDALRVSAPQQLLRELGVAAKPLQGRLQVSGKAQPQREAERSIISADEPPVSTAVDLPPPVPTAPPEPLALLQVDTSGIANVRIRQCIDAITERLNQRFDSMLARHVAHGLFVALAEFDHLADDHGAIVRALHDAGLLATDGATPSRKVCSEVIEGRSYPGIVLRCDRLQGHAEWQRRWHDNDDEVDEEDRDALDPPPEPPPKTGPVLP